MIMKLRLAASKLAGIIVLGISLNTLAGESIAGAKYFEGTAGYAYVVRLSGNPGSNAVKAPLIIMLHGAAPEIKLSDLRRFGPMRYVATHTNAPFIVACPVTHQGWSIPTLRIFANGLRRAFPQIDWTRVYLTGDSMGGHATWAWACADPQLFAAIVPICGAGDPNLAKQRLAGMPTWIFHGEKDRVVPVTYGKTMHQALQQAGAPVRATFYPDRDHDSWTPAWRTPELYDWLLEQKRPSILSRTQ